MEPQVAQIANVASLRGRDFLDIGDLDPDQLRALLSLAARIKSGDWTEKPLQDRHIAMLFQRPSHRTRVSFEVGITRLGGHSVVLGEQDVQIGVRESVGDAARVLDRYVDGVVARLFTHEYLLELAANAQVPVINALSERSHPCQVLADLLTIEETFGSLSGRKMVYVGDGNNVTNSLMEASSLLGFPLTVISPAAYRPPPAAVERARKLAANGAELLMTPDLDAVAGAAVVYTDVWTSMGQERERELRLRDFGGYQVNRALMDRAPDAYFMHCLPAHRGEEVSDDVIDGPRSLVFDQAGNRLYAQMALLAGIYA
jgi:ornithine carbamoyltransferase